MGYLCKGTVLLGTAVETLWHWGGGSGHAAPRWLLALLSYLLFCFLLFFLCARKAAKQIKDRYGPPCPPVPLTPTLLPARAGGPVGAWGAVRAGWVSGCHPH